MNQRPHDNGDPLAPPHDELHDLLTAWHDTNRQTAAAGRDRLLQALSEEMPVAKPATPVRDDEHESPDVRAVLAYAWRLIMNRYTPAAASIALLLTFFSLWYAQPQAVACEIMVPDGGRLDARDDRGALIGPCALKHTDVEVDVSGLFSRVTVKQTYENTYPSRIEAVYTFPLSHRGAVDRMTMTVGDRVVVGEVKERQEARRIYEAAKQQQYVAGLLEQERPNIFTQSIANIEPGAAIDIEISYVETLQLRDGEFRFEFPTVVAPRYIPGSVEPISPGLLPAGVKHRYGVVLRAPARITVTQGVQEHDSGALQAALRDAVPVHKLTREAPVLVARFEVRYADGSIEHGTLHADNTGQVNGRWFFVDPNAAHRSGGGFARNTNEVPDASRITPMPVRPDTRTGHDIAIAVNIDTGGPGITNLSSELHGIVRMDENLRGDGTASKVRVELQRKAEIPNRDFLLTWRQTDDTIEESIFTHSSQLGEFVTLVINPPARVDDAMARPRELTFVLDCSGSMKDFPIEQAKKAMIGAIETMRQTDTFNVVTFNNHAERLWPAPRKASAANVREAMTYVQNRQGGGGTQMMQGVMMALAGHDGARHAPLTPEKLVNLPADGREVTIEVAGWQLKTLSQDGIAPSLVEIVVRDDLRFRASIRSWQIDQAVAIQPMKDEPTFFRFKGNWVTTDGHRELHVTHATELESRPAPPMRVCLFLTDGQIGNDSAVVQAVADHADDVRMFTLGIGNSPNRSLMDAMATAARGASDYLSLNGNADEVVQRFVNRIANPVLTDITLSFGGDLDGIQWLPATQRIPDLYDEAPIILHGRCTVSDTEDRDTARGSVTITGLTGAGRYEQTFELDLPKHQPEHDVIASLWGRAKVDELMARNDVRGVIDVATEFQVMSKHTSFVAVEKSRFTAGDTTMLVTVPIEMVSGQSWEGTFGSAWPTANAIAQRALGAAQSSANLMIEDTIPAGDHLPTDIELVDKVRLYIPAVDSHFAHATAAGQPGIAGIDFDGIALIHRTVLLDGTSANRLVTIPDELTNELIVVDDAEIAQFAAEQMNFDDGYAAAGMNLIGGRERADVLTVRDHNYARRQLQVRDLGQNPFILPGAPALKPDGTSAEQPTAAAEPRFAATSTVGGTTTTGEPLVEGDSIVDAMAGQGVVRPLDAAPTAPPPAPQPSKSVTDSRRGGEAAEQRHSRIPVADEYFRKRQAPQDEPETAADDDTDRRDDAVRDRAVATKEAGAAGEALESLGRRVQAVTGEDVIVADALEVTEQAAPQTQPPAAAERQTAETRRNESSLGMPIEDKAEAAPEPQPLPITEPLLRLARDGWKSLPVGQRPIAPAHVAMAAIRLALQQQDDAALTVAKQLSSQLGGYVPADDLITLLQEQNVSAEDRKERLQAILVAATDDLDRVAAAWNDSRLARLARVVDERLWPHLITPSETDVQVSVLLTDTKAPTLETLRNAGLTIEGVARKRPHVVGTLKANHLESIALLEFTRRIESR